VNANIDVVRYSILWLSEFTLDLWPIE